jgi:urease beta subunit
MSVQTVMGHTGDTRHFFDADDAAALTKAEARFKRLTGQGFTAAVRTGPGEVIKVTSFNLAAAQCFYFAK